MDDIKAIELDGSAGEGGGQILRTAHKTKQSPNALPIRSWCADVEEGALKQAENLSRHPALVSHVALMPDCHVGYGMPIGGVVAADDAVIPAAVGVDIGCGMRAVETDLPAERFADMRLRRALQERLKERIFYIPIEVCLVEDENPEGLYDVK